ncbi:hypothetical protein ACJO5Y_11325 [Marinobacter sp. GN3S48]|uniref:hypothetical protein n=1 Tax=Marinobacter sp. GN3S48 TaxID=3382302 RepID=UPI00387AD8ED
MPNSFKSVYNRYVSVRLSLIVLILLIVSLMVVGYMFFTGDANTKLGSLMGGLTATFVAVLIQFLLAMAHHREIERLKRMGFQDILPHRDDRQRYYAELIRSARKRIDFLGKTANSFLSDFAFSEEGAAPVDRLLLDAMQRGVKVRILVAGLESLPQDKQEQQTKVIARMRELREEYGDNFEYRYLSSMPGQTYVLADRNCIFGPVLPMESSRLSPAIHADSDSPFLESYFRFFERQWKEGAQKNATDPA